MVHAICEMVEDRLMLCEDAGDELVRLLAAGATAGVPAGPADFQAPPLCNGTKHHHDHDDGHGHDHHHDD